MGPTQFAHVLITHLKLQVPYETYIKCMFYLEYFTVYILFKLYCFLWHFQN